MDGSLDFIIPCSGYRIDGFSGGELSFVEYEDSCIFRRNINSRFHPPFPPSRFPYHRARIRLDWNRYRLSIVSHPISFLGSVLVLAGLVMVILYAKSLLNKLKERAYLDHLTRLYTRAFFFEEWLPKEINRQEREENGRITFIFIDLDNLKEINDRFSHQTGDEALKILAKAIKENIRRTDAAVRYGGDEFLIALPSEGIDTAKKVIRRIRNSVRREKFKTSISITAGITEWKVGEDIVKAIKEADRKMYEFKRKKKM